MTKTTIEKEGSGGFVTRNRDEKIYSTMQSWRSDGTGFSRGVEALSRTHKEEER